jgi:hypothetical protein
MLRGKKPEAIQKRLKALFYGKAGVGKTMAAIQFPKPYLIDTERGAENQQYINILEKSGGVIFNTGDFDELIKEVKLLLTVKHEYKTLIIDPLTIIYNDLLDKAAAQLSTGGKDGTEFGRHYGIANKRIKHLLSLLLRLDMNVIITSHAKTEFSSNLTVIGQTFDCYKKLDYLFDLVLKIEKTGKDRTAFVEKTRIEGFKEFENFPFSFAEISKRYSLSILEKESVPEILASKEDIIDLKHLIQLLKVSNETVDKWLAKSNSETLDEMKQADIQSIIAWLKNKITPEVLPEPKPTEEN